MELPGPSGCRQSAPGVQAHHWEKSRRFTGPAGGVNTSEPGTSVSGGGGGVPGGDLAHDLLERRRLLRRGDMTGRLDEVRNCALVTSVRSSQNPPTRTRCAGLSSGQADSASLPMVNSPPEIQAMPGGAGSALQCGSRHTPRRTPSARRRSRPSLVSWIRLDPAAPLRGAEQVMPRARARTPSWRAGRPRSENASNCRSSMAREMSQNNAMSTPGQLAYRGSRRSPDSRIRSGRSFLAQR